MLKFFKNKFIFPNQIFILKEKILHIDYQLILEIFKLCKKNVIIYLTHIILIQNILSSILYKIFTVMFKSA